MNCKYYQDEFCVNADSPCVADYCPCTQYPDLCKYYEGSRNNSPTYAELYEHWLKTKDRPKRKPKQLPGQLSLFNTTE